MHPRPASNRRLLAAGPSAERTFPADSGMLNVQTMFGAKGDGTTDDTAAIQAAYQPSSKSRPPRASLFPAGTYLVSSPLLWKDTTRAWELRANLPGKTRARRRSS